MGASKAAGGWLGNAPYRVFPEDVEEEGGEPEAQGEGANDWQRPGPGGVDNRREQRSSDVDHLLGDVDPWQGDDGCQGGGCGSRSQTGVAADEAKDGASCGDARGDDGFGG